MTPTETALITPGNLTVVAGGDEGAYSPTISANGRFVAFASSSSNLVPGDVASTQDVFVWDHKTKTNTLISQNGSASWDPVISADGRYVAYQADEDLQLGNSDVYLRDRLSGGTTLLGHSEPLEPGGPLVDHLAISGDGRFVAYHGSGGLVVWERTTGSTTQIGQGRFPALSGDGHYLAFSAGPVNHEDVFVRDLVTGTTTPLTHGNGPSQYPAISADGRFVAFMSAASDLVPEDDTSGLDVFLADRATGTMTRIPNGSRGSYYPDISADGKFVSFLSASKLVPHETNRRADFYVWNSQTQETMRITNGNARPYEFSEISADGRHIAFASPATDLVDNNDANGYPGVFVWDRR
jgi:Tol biopolymer transport system component